MKTYTIKDFNQEFPTDESCLEWLKNHLYPNGMTCPKCQKVTKHYLIRGRTAYSCDICGTHSYPMAHTILRKSSTPLRSWMYAIYLISSTRCGISAKQLQRELGVTYKTAWRMFHEIRSLLVDGTTNLSGCVEADETYIGGKRHGTRGRGAEGKTPVFGMLERGAAVVATVTSDVKGSSLKPIIQTTVAPNSTICTDELPSYDGLSRIGFTHKRVNHAAKQYVIGKDIHTNTIEGFWSQLKRSIDGTYHHVSPKWLPLYVSEYSFRYNHRHDETPMFCSALTRL